MGSETRAGADDVVVVDEEQAVVGVRRIVVLAEAERVLLVAPVDLGGEALGGSADVDGRGGVRHGVLGRGVLGHVP
jgi:hypothetical protein